MKMIEATYRNGVFAPDDGVDLTEGTRVMLSVQVVKPKGAPGRIAFSPLVPDAPLEQQEQGAPCDLPMPSGILVRAQEGTLLLPDPPLLLHETR